MKNKYFILALTFLCLLVGHSSYAFGSGEDYNDDWYGGELDQVDIFPDDWGDTDPVIIINDYVDFDDPFFDDPIEVPEPPAPDPDPDNDFDSPDDNGDTCTTTCPTGYNLINCECVPVPKDPCIEEANNKIKQITEVKFAEILSKFNNPNSPFKVNIISKSFGVGDARLGRIELSGVPRTYNIVLNEDFPNATSLSREASILHEYVHAYFNILYDDWKNNGNTNAYDDYPVLKSYYLKDPAPYWGDSQDAHHEQIADSFVDNIAAAIQELNPDLTPEYCRDLAWATMQGTAAYNSDAYLTLTERDRIGKERAAERDNQETGIYKPKGNPCTK